MNRDQGKFIALYVATWSPDRLYRIYIIEETMYFICLSRYLGLERVLRARNGPLGMLVLKVAAKQGEGELKALLSTLDVQHPRGLLDADEHNLAVSVQDVEEARLEPPSRFPSHGEHFGRWLLKLTGKKPMTFQFPRLAHMQEAYRMLPDILGSKLQLAARWDPIKERFSKA